MDPFPAAVLTVEIWITKPTQGGSFNKKLKDPYNESLLFRQYLLKVVKSEVFYHAYVFTCSIRNCPQQLTKNFQLSQFPTIHFQVLLLMDKILTS